MTNSKIISQLPAVADGLTSYIRDVRESSPLTAEEEFRLALAYREKNDLQAAKTLALSHLRLVVSVARGYIGYGLEQNDLIQEGNIGLLKAVQKFDPRRGARLATFAVYWIRAEIHEFIMRNWRIIKIATTKAQRKMFFHMNRLLRKQDDGRIEGADTIARDLNIQPDDVVEMRRRLHDTNTVPFYETDDEHEGAKAILADEAGKTNPECILLTNSESGDRHNALKSALDTLDERALSIITARRLTEKPATLQSLSDKFKVSIERIRQLEVKAMKKLELELRQRLSTA